LYINLEYWYRIFTMIYYNLYRFFDLKNTPHDMTVEGRNSGARRDSHFARQWHGNHTSVATDMHRGIEEWSRIPWNSTNDSCASEDK
jgi:hypothetical protein